MNTALSAAEKKKALKQHIDILKQKDKVITSKGDGKTNNNVFVGTNDDLMKLLGNGTPDPLDPNDTSVIDVVPENT